MKEAEMFVEGYKAVLVKHTSYKGLWKVSFYAERILAQIMSDFCRMSGMMEWQEKLRG